MTRRLYYDDSYTLEFSARVSRLQRDPQGRFAVVLEETYFYPTSGGQMHDRGWMNQLEVVDVVDVEGGILHVLDGELDLKPGARIEAAIDGDRRRHHRQQHTGQHVLSRVLEDRLGLPTISSRLGETGNTLDVPGTTLQRRALEEVEDRVHRILWEGRPVQVRYVDETTEPGLRAAKSRPGPARIIEILGVDRCPCGGTHVSNTSEVGTIALDALEKIRGDTRIHFRCGDAAVLERRRSHRLLKQLASSLTTASEELPATVEKLRQDNRDLQRRGQRLAEELVRHRVEEWIANAPRLSHDGRTVRWVLRSLDEDEGLAAGVALQALASQPEVLATLVVFERGRGQLLVARGADLTVDCVSLAQDCLSELGGRGGGSAVRARGGFGRVDPDEALTVLRRRIETWLGGGPSTHAD